MNSSQNTIGGLQDRAGSAIAFNCDAIEVGLNACDSSALNTILGNSIFKNKKLGIDLHKKCPSVQGGGTNNGQAGPVLKHIKINRTQFLVTGKLESLANTSFLIQLFISPDACPGQGKVLLTTITVTTNNDGFVCFETAVPGFFGAVITATATRLDNGIPADTSEFSKPLKS